MTTKNECININFVVGEPGVGKTTWGINKIAGFGEKESIHVYAVLNTRQIDEIKARLEKMGVHNVVTVRGFNTYHTRCPFVWAFVSKIADFHKEGSNSENKEIEEIFSRQTEAYSAKPHWKEVLEKLAEPWDPELAEFIYDSISPKKAEAFFEDGWNYGSLIFCKLCSGYIKKFLKGKGINISVYHGEDKIYTGKDAEDMHVRDYLSDYCPYKHNIYKAQEKIKAGYNIVITTSDFFMSGFFRQFDKEINVIFDNAGYGVFRINIGKIFNYLEVGILAFLNNLLSSTNGNYRYYVEKTLNGIKNIEVNRNGVEWEFKSPLNENNLCKINYDNFFLVKAKKITETMTDLENNFVFKITEDDNVKGLKMRIFIRKKPKKNIKGWTSFWHALREWAKILSLRYNRYDLYLLLLFNHLVDIKKLLNLFKKISKGASKILIPKPVFGILVNKPKHVYILDTSGNIEIIKDYIDRAIDNPKINEMRLSGNMQEYTLKFTTHKYNGGSATKRVMSAKSFDMKKDRLMEIDIDNDTLLIGTRTIKIVDGNVRKTVLLEEIADEFGCGDSLYFGASVSFNSNSFRHFGKAVVINFLYVNDKSIIDTAFEMGVINKVEYNNFIDMLRHKVQLRVKQNDIMIFKDECLEKVRRWLEDEKFIEILNRLRGGEIYLTFKPSIYVLKRLSDMEWTIDGGIVIQRKDYNILLDYAQMMLQKAVLIISRHIILKTELTPDKMDEIVENVRTVYHSNGDLKLPKIVAEKVIEMARKAVEKEDGYAVWKLADKIVSYWVNNLDEPMIFVDESNNSSDTEMIYIIDESVSETTNDDWEKCITRKSAPVVLENTDSEVELL